MGGLAEACPSSDERGDVVRGNEGGCQAAPGGSDVVRTSTLSDAPEAQSAAWLRCESSKAR